jgi:hypothetical protein
MRNFTTRSLFLLAISCGMIFGQNVQIAVVTSSYPVTFPTGSSLNFSYLNLTVGYPVGLTPSQYISASQLNTDFQGFISAYPSPTDPPEAILSTALQGILGKYSQMTGGSLLGEIAGPSQTIGTITIPGSPIGTITVTIETYNPSTGYLGILEKQRSSSKTVHPPAPEKPVPATNSSAR